MTSALAATAPIGRVVIVDDDDLYRQSVCENLTDCGFEVADFSDGAEAIEYLTDGNAADLVLLDWHMPEISGLQLLKKIKEANLALPVVFLTSHSGQAFEETAFMNGAVDFVDKTRSFTILFNRLCTILAGRKGQYVPLTVAPAREPVRIGALELQMESCAATWQGQKVPLTVTEFKIVYCLATRSGRNVSHRDIYDNVHGVGFVAGDGENGFRTNVRTLIKRIRQKFCEVDSSFDAIQTFSGFGYLWQVREAATRRRSAADAPAAMAAV